MPIINPNSSEAPASVAIPMCSMTRCAPGSEVWVHLHDNNKFQQYGWRCTDAAYNTDHTLIHNWYEEKRDYNKAKLKEKVNSNVSIHYTI